MDPYVTTLLLVIITGLIGLGVYLAITKSVALSYIPLSIGVGLIMSPLLAGEYVTTLGVISSMVIMIITLMKLAGFLK
jgi:hypothetical protein